MRARPVPFCFHSFLPEPETSCRVLVDALPPRGRPANAAPLHKSGARSPARRKLRRPGRASRPPVLFKSIISTLGMAVTSSPSAPARSRRWDPGTAPLTISTLSSVSTSHDFEIADGHLLVPKWPAMRVPGNTRDGKLEAPIEPGARWNMEPCALGTAPEMMPLDQAAEAAALADADDVHFVGGLELIHQNAVALLQVVVAGPQLQLRAGTSRLRRSAFFR